MIVSLFIKRFFVITLLLIGTFAIVRPAYAADLNVDCPTPPAACTKMGLDPLFSAALDGVWIPGKTVTKIINLKNSSSVAQDLEIQGSRVSSPNSLENILTISIVPTGGGPVIWAGTVAQFYAANNILVGNFASGASLDEDFTISMDASADNSYQSVETVFDLTAGFWGVISPTPTPSSSGGGGSSGGDTGTGGGEVLGSGVTSSVCTDAAPGGAPTLTSVVSGNNNATLTWTQAANPVTYYLIAYGTSPGTYTYGNPNVGGSGTTNYTVTNLSGGTTYYFVVRAGNGCMPGPFSNERSTAPVGGAVAGPAAGFTEGVLGVSTKDNGASPTATVSLEASPTAPESSGAVEGSNSSCADPWWKLLLLIGEAAFLLLMSFVLEKGEKTNWWLSLGIGAIIPGTIVWFLFCNKIPWLIAVLAIALGGLLLRGTSQEQADQ